MSEDTAPHGWVLAKPPEFGRPRVYRMPGRFDYIDDPPDIIRYYSAQEQSITLVRTREPDVCYPWGPGFPGKRMWPEDTSEARQLAEEKAQEMSEDQAPCIAKGDFLVASIETPDPFGAKAVWHSHYDLAIETMHPISAVKAANAAALAYAEGNNYISMGGKGDAAEYRMVRSKEVGR